MIKVSRVMGVSNGRGSSRGSVCSICSIISTSLTMMMVIF
jgi:hypothetical protein